MDEATDLVVTPFRDIVEKGQQAVNNAGDNDEMRKAAQTLVKEGERALKRIEPVCAKNFEEYGMNFLDTLKANEEITSYRSQLNDLLWEFDDYIEPDDFDASKFVALQSLSRKAAPKIVDMLKIMKVEALPRNDPHVRSFMSQLSPPSSPIPGSSATYQRSNSPSSSIQVTEGIAPDEIVSSPGPIVDRPGSQGEIDPNFVPRTLPTPNRSSGGSEQQPPRPPLDNPWAIGVRTAPGEGVKAGDESPIDHRLLIESPVDPFIAPASTGRRPSSLVLSPPTTSPPGPPPTSVLPELPAPTQGSRSFEQSRQSPNNLSAAQANLPSQQRSRADTFSSIATGEDRSDAPNNPTASTDHDEFTQPASISSPSYYSHLRQPSQSSYLESSRTMKAVHPPSQTSMSSYFQGSSGSITNANHPSLSPGISANFGYRNHASSISETISSGAISPTSHALDSQPGLEVASMHPSDTHDMQSIPEVDYGLIPVETETDTAPLAAVVSPRSSNIGHHSSFYLLKGFCDGAREVIQGTMGVKKTKRPGFTTAATVGRCTSCLFEVDYKDVENDINRLDSGNFHRSGIYYRLRFVQKSHLATKRVDDVMYGCVFCIHEGRALDESDATVFFNTKTLFKHLARHPRPLPAVPGITVIETPTLPPAVTNNYDLHFRSPPEPHPALEKAAEIAALPTGTAKEAQRRLYGQKLLPDRTPAHEVAQGARITGLTWPSKYNGEWVFCWHEGAHASLPSDIIKLDPPPMGEIKMGGTSNIQAKTRWKFGYKDKERGEWLKFDKGETITNISFPYMDHWCWSGTNAKGKWGIFPQAFIEPNSVSENATSSDRASLFRSETARSASSKLSSSFSKMSLRKGSGRPPSISESVSSRETKPFPTMNVSASYLAHKNQQYHNRD